MAQREVQDVEDLLLRVAVQVDQQIAARDEVEPRKRRVAHQVVQRKEHRFAHFATHPVAVVLFNEEALEPVLRNIGRNDVRVHAFACDADRVFVEVGREDLYARWRRDLACVFAQQDRDRVGLLAGRARRYPDADRFVHGLAVEQPRKVAFERVEGVRVAEEIGDADQHVLQQRTGFAGMRAQDREVGRQVGHAVDLHAAADAAQDGRALVVREVAAGARAQEREHLAQFRFLALGP